MNGVVMSRAAATAQVEQTSLLSIDHIDTYPDHFTLWFFP